MYGRTTHSILAISTLLRCALQAVPLQKDSPADLPIWGLIEEKLTPTRTELSQAIIRKLAWVQSPHKMQLGVKFIMSRLEGEESTDTLAPALVETMDQPAWPHLWLRLVAHLRESKLLEFGRDWLKGREDKPEWAHVWRRLLDEDFEKVALLLIGRDWLNGREDKPEWAHVWRRLLDEDLRKSLSSPSVATG